MDGPELLKEHIGPRRGARAEFARQIGCSQPHLSLVLKGKRGLSPELGQKASRATGIPLEKLCPKLADVLRENAA
jgi:transcriptional regulator with XRE-family HTH domain